MEIQLLDRLIHDRPAPGHHQRPLSSYVIRLARLGGYLARTHDPPPGNAVIWRGMNRLTDIELGFALGAQIVGNSKVRRALTMSLHVLAYNLKRMMKILGVGGLMGALQAR